MGDATNRLSVGVPGGLVHVDSVRDAQQGTRGHWGWAWGVLWRLGRSFVTSGVFCGGLSLERRPPHTAAARKTADTNPTKIIGPDPQQLTP